jgi:hypothetical protein
MKLWVFLMLLGCVVAAGSAGAAPVKNVSKVFLFGVYLVEDSSCPEATHLLVHVCQTGLKPRAYVRLKQNEDVSSLQNVQLNVKGNAAKGPSSCSLPVLDSPRMDPLLDSVYDCFD